MFEALKKYAVFTGRARRREYWLYFLLYLILAIIANIIDRMTGMYSYETNVGVLSTLLMLALLIPTLAVGVRRLHDIDRSGWWLLIGLIPIVGGIVLLVFFCLDGTAGTNRFGLDPKSA